MRISTQTLFESNVAAMNQQQARLQQTQQQVASGRRILTASDDPVAASRALDISQSDAVNAQHTANRDAARHTLSLAETALQNVTSLLQDVKTATVNAGNATLNLSDRRTIAADLSGRLQQLVGLANSSDGIGNYLFAGFQSRTLPFTDIAGVMSYNGDDGQRLMQVSSARQIPSSNSGADVFMRIKNGNGTFATQAGAANTGTGIISQGTVSDPAALTGHSYSITYAGPAASAAVGNTGTGVASTPIVANPAAVTGNDYSVTFSVVGAVTTYDVTTLTAVGSNTQNITTLDFSTPGTFVVDAAGDNITVTLDGAPFADEAALVAKIQSDLGASYNVTSTGTVGGADFAVTITRVATGSGSTAVTVDPDPVAMLGGLTSSAGNTNIIPGATVLSGQPYVSGNQIVFDGLQFDIQGAPADGDSFTVSSPGYTVTDTTTATTVLPVPPAPGRMVFTSGQAISFDGIQLDIQGTPADGDSFTVTPSVNESIFKTISDLITALNGSAGASLTNSLNRGLNNLDRALDNVLSVRSSLGVRLNEIDALQSAGDDLSLQFKQALSQLQDVDYNQAISDLVQQQTNLQAAQKTFSRVAGLSLFDYL